MEWYSGSSNGWYGQDRYYIRFISSLLNINILGWDLQWTIDVYADDADVDKVDKASIGIADVDGAADNLA